MRTRSGSIFYKILILFILLGVLPAGLISGRLLILNRDLLEQATETWSLPSNVVQEITETLADEAGIYLVYTLLVTGLISIFISGGLISPIRQLQRVIISFRQGHLDESMSIHTGDEIEDLATSFNQMARELSQTQTNLQESITERARDLEQRAFQLQIAAQIAQDTAAARDLEELLDRTVDLIRERFNFYFVSIFLIDDNCEYAVLRAATGEAGKAQLERKYRLKIGDVGIVTYVASTGDMRVVNNVDFDFVYLRDPLLPLTRSEAALPLRIQPDVIGVLDVQSTNVNTFTEGDVASLQILADQIAVAIQNERLVGELDSRLKEINTLYQRYTQEIWSQQIGSEQAIGYQYDMSEVSPLLHRETLDEFTKNNTQATVASDKTDGKKKSTLIAPLKMFDQVIGLLGVESEEDAHQWTAEETAMLEAVSSQVSLTLDNARLLEESRKRAEQLRLLQEITSVAASHIKAEELLDDIAGKLCDAYNIPYCRILLFDPDGKHGTLMGTSPIPDASGMLLAGAKIRVEDSEIIARAITTKEAIVINDVWNSPEKTDAYIEIGPQAYRSIAMVPVILRGDTIGIIELYSFEASWILSQDDLQLLSQISSQTATAVDISRSFERTAQRAEWEKMMTTITSRMRETLDVKMVMETAVNEIYRTFNLDSVSCYLVPSQPENEKLSPALTAETHQAGNEEA